MKYYTPNILREVIDEHCRRSILLNGGCFRGVCADSYWTCLDTTWFSCHGTSAYFIFKKPKKNHLNRHHNDKTLLSVVSVKWQIGYVCDQWWAVCFIELRLSSEWSRLPGFSVESRLCVHTHTHRDFWNKHLSGTESQNKQWLRHSEPQRGMEKGSSVFMMKEPCGLCMRKCSCNTPHSVSCVSSSRNWVWETSSTSLSLTHTHTHTSHTHTRLYILCVCLWHLVAVHGAEL